MGLYGMGKLRIGEELHVAISMYIFWQVDIMAFDGRIINAEERPQKHTFVLTHFSLR
jgi:hypothetical protein